MEVHNGENGFSVGGGLISTSNKAHTAGFFAHSGYGMTENGAVVVWRAMCGDKCKQLGAGDEV
jgi:long-subunit acyl-CoA synthetase (AMP-forming)